MVFGGGLDSVCAWGESSAGQLLCRNNLSLCFFQRIFGGCIKVLYRVLNGGGKET
jgi:hypothetical protein